MIRRIMAPTGKLGYVPEENLAAAIEAGARVMGPDEMRVLRQQVFMEHSLFQHERRPVEKRRKSRLIRSSR